MLVVSLKGIVTKMNRLAVNHLKVTLTLTLNEVSHKSEINRSPVSMERVLGRHLLCYFKSLWLQEIVKEGVNKSNPNPVIISHAAINS
jgi:hypothetical protein